MKLRLPKEVSSRLASCALFHASTFMTADPFTLAPPHPVGIRQAQEVPRISRGRDIRSDKYVLAFRW